MTRNITKAGRLHKFYARRISKEQNFAATVARYSREYRDLALDCPDPEMRALYLDTAATFQRTAELTARTARRMLQVELWPHQVQAA